MANPEHLKLVKQGTQTLTSWQQENPDDVLDLEGADLSGVNLVRARIRNANLKGANLSDAKLGRAILSYPGFAPEGFEIVAALDSDPSVVEKVIGSLE